MEEKECEVKIIEQKDTPMEVQSFGWGKKEWATIVILILLSNAATLFVTSKYLIPKIKVVDIVKLLDEGRRSDLQGVLDGKMTQDDFIAKQKIINSKVENAINSQTGTVLIKQCVMGTKNEDITSLVKTAAEK
ncbi:MAG: hypothetical protein WCW84_11325 [Sulfurimonas sp.]